jgi:hypothetical protein
MNSCGRSHTSGLLFTAAGEMATSYARPVNTVTHTPSPRMGPERGLTVDLGMA